MKRSPLRSRAHRVTVDERAEYDFVAQRDAGCVAPRLDPDAGPCSGRLTRQHVKAGPGAPRVTHRSQLLMLCEHHHLWSGWATSKDALMLQRMYLTLLYPEAWGAR